MHLNRVIDSDYYVFKVINQLAHFLLNDGVLAKCALLANFCYHCWYPQQNFHLTSNDHNCCILFNLVEEKQHYLDFLKFDYLCFNHDSFSHSCHSDVLVFNQQEHLCSGQEDFDFYLHRNNFILVKQKMRLFIAIGQYWALKYCHWWSGLGFDCGCFHGFEGGHGHS